MRKEIETEILVVKEAVDLVNRRPSYAKMVAGLYMLSLFGLERSRIMRASYLPVRKIDDALDGDAPKIRDPLAYARLLRDGITNKTLGKSSEERLLQYSLDVLEAKAKQNDDPRGDFVKAIDAIVFDHERATQRRVLSAEEIEQYYRDAFDPVINITLQAIDSNFRSRDIPVLSYGQGRVYSARDFAVDWKRGILNVPEDVISSTGLSSSSPFEEVGRNTKIIDWFHQSLATTKPDLLDAQSLLRQSEEKQTQVVGNSLISPMLKFIEAH